MNSPILVLWHHAVEAIEGAFGELLGSKHLYQSVTIEGELEVDVLSASVRDRGSQLLRGTWRCVGPTYSRAVPIREWESQNGELDCRPPSIRIFCAACDRREPANLMAAESRDLVVAQGELPAERKTVQIFVLSYECQGCHGPWEVFLVRRRGLRLTLCGRAPMEQIEVAQVIPKVIRNYYRDAHLAHNSGQTLAGNFLLRTAVEQWSRLFADDSVKGGDAVEAYQARLPDDFKRRFPSLKSVYERLSADIHAATGSVDVFEDGARDIERHFHARRLFDLEGPPAR